MFPNDILAVLGAADVGKAVLAEQSIGVALKAAFGNRNVPPPRTWPICATRTPTDPACSFLTQVGPHGSASDRRRQRRLPLKRDGAIVGGVGIFGGSPDADEEICRAIMSAAGFKTDFPAWAGTRKQRPGPLPSAVWIARIVVIGAVGAR